MTESNSERQAQPNPLVVPHLRVVYTISCGMPAKMFFELLKQHGNPLVVDTRGARWSRNGGFAVEADVEYICELHGVAYAHLPELAPDKDRRQRFRKEFEAGNATQRAIAWTSFLKDYLVHISRTNKTLREGSPLREIVSGDQESVVIVCACQRHEHCHRQVTAGMLAKWISGVRVQHLYPDPMPKFSGRRRYLIEDMPGACLKANPPNWWRS